jgi:Tfp pilus assembly protein PilP
LTLVAVLAWASTAGAQDQPGQEAAAPPAEVVVPAEVVAPNAPEGDFQPASLSDGQQPSDFAPPPPPPPFDFPRVPSDAPPPVPPALPTNDEPDLPPKTPEEAKALEAKKAVRAELEAWRDSILEDYAFGPTIGDPFMPIETVARPPDVDKKKELDRRKPVLQRLALNQFTLNAIVLTDNPDRTSALVDNAGVGYILHRGTLIGPNNGYVKEITANTVIIEEPETNYLGETRLRVTELRLYPESEELGEEALQLLRE